LPTSPALEHTRSPSPERARHQKLSINLSEDAARVVKELADAKGTTVTEVIRRGIALERFIVDHLDGGATFLVKQPDGSIETVHFVFG
jgi:hypothetical protein